MSKEDNEPKKLFGTSGIRGPLGTAVNTELALKIGKSLSNLLGAGSDIVLGYDTRTSNQMLEKALTAGILEGGCNVLSLGMAPTPLVGYATMKLGADAGIMITASHNPPQDNGIKVWNNDGMAYRSDQEKELEEIFFNDDYHTVSWDNIGSIKDIRNIQDEYIKDLLDFVNIKPGLKVVVDCANGAASHLSPMILRMAGCEVITLNSQPDGFFPGRMPEPSEAHLQDLMKLVKATQSDLGIAHDGDADRMVAVDENGKLADFDKLLALVSAQIGGCVITTVDASACIDQAMEQVKGKVMRTKVGDVHVAEMIQQEKAAFGGEPSGTWIHPQFCMCPDGILSALRVIELVQNKGPLSKLLDNIISYPTIRDKINCKEDQKQLILKKAETELASIFDDVVDVNQIDGVRITFSDGSWVLIRPSGTESYVRITLEGKTEDKAREIHEVSEKFIRNLL